MKTFKQLNNPETGNRKPETTDTKKRSSPPLDASSSAVTDRARSAPRRRRRFLKDPSRGGREGSGGGEWHPAGRDGELRTGADQFGGAGRESRGGRAGRDAGVAIHLHAAQRDQFLFQTRSQ